MKLCNTKHYLLNKAIDGRSPVFRNRGKQLLNCRYCTVVGVTAYT